MIEPSLPVDSDFLSASPRTSSLISSMVYFFAPAATFALVAVLTGAAMSEKLLTKVSPLLPHVAMAASLAAVAYWIIAAISQTKAHRLRVAMTVSASTVLAHVVVVFYILLWVSLTNLGELPTRKLVLGYLDEFPQLVANLPISRAYVVTFGVALALVLAAVSALWSICFLKARRDFVRLVERDVAGISFRLLALGGLLYATLGFIAPYSWHEDSHEPVLSSWHNLGIATNRVQFQRNAIEAATDSQIRAETASTSAKRRPNVVLIYVDALRADVTQPYGAHRSNMPFISSMVKSGALSQVEFALSGCPGTICALAGILQSRPTWLQSPDNLSLQRVLVDQGYKTHFILSSNHRDYYDLKEYYEPIHYYFDGKDAIGRMGSDDYLVPEQLEKLGPWNGSPVFLMLGLVSTHSLAYRAPKNRKFLPDRAHISNPEDSIESYRNNYDNGILQADHVIELIWRVLHRNGYLENAIVVITGDHGESLGEDGIFGHMKSLRNVELRVPLWLFDSKRGSANLRIRFARHFDIAPTIVSRLGLVVPRTWRGRSLDEGSTEWSDHYIQSLPRQLAIVRLRNGVAIKYVVDRQSGVESAYSIFDDPLEQRDVLGELSEQEISTFRDRASSILAGK